MDTLKTTLDSNFQLTHFRAHDHKRSGGWFFRASRALMTLTVLSFFYLLVSDATASDSNIVYPQIERKSGLEGEVLISFDINNTGRAVNIKIVGDAHKSFASAAIRGLKQTQFENGPSDRTQQRRYRFQLQNLPGGAENSRDYASSEVLAAR